MVIHYPPTTAPGRSRVANLVDSPARVTAYR